MSTTQSIPECLSESQPLPDLKVSTLDQSDHESVAALYNHVLHAEALAWERLLTDTIEGQHGLIEPTLVNIRFVGWLLVALHQGRKSLGDTPMRHVEDVWRVLHERGRQGIQERGDLYRRLVRRTWTWRCNEPTTQDYQYTFIDFQEWLEDPVAVEEEFGPWDDSTISKFQAFTRDGFRCLVAPKSYSRSYLNANPAIRSGGNRPCRLEDARIIPNLQKHMVGKDTCPSIAKIMESTPGSVLELFGLSEVVAGQLAPDDNDHLSNILSLSEIVRHAFESLCLWLVATDNPNEYRVHCASEDFSEEIPNDTVTFRNQADKVVGLPQDVYVSSPLPDARLLAVHASCAFAITMSGEPGYTRIWERERDKDPYYIALRCAMEDMEMNM